LLLLSCGAGFFIENEIKNKRLIGQKELVKIAVIMGEQKMTVILSVPKCSWMTIALLSFENTV